MHIPDIIKKVLSTFGVHGDQAIQAYLAPQLVDLPSPWDLKGLREAVDLFCNALHKQYEILIWGDYDVDGTSGTALLVNFLRELGTEPLWHIPNRLEDGYGLNSTTFRQLHQEHICDRPFLLITVDCGTSNVREIQDILAMGGEVIVTDHHQMPIHDLPDCTFLNPNQPGCLFHDAQLAGVGVAFYLASAIRAELDRQGYFTHSSKPNMKEYLGFVALGTIADLVPITPANRILVRAGMEVLSRPKIAGLQALMQSVELLGHTITSEDISFTLAPRINAAGRLGRAEVAVHLMTCDNREEGAILGKELGLLNERRKAICSDNLETALTSIGDTSENSVSTIQVAGNFHFGTVGIVASKLIERFGMVTLVFSRQQDEQGREILKGSGRSIQGVDLLESLHETSSYLLKYGGHAMAAGLTLRAEEYLTFCRAFDLSVQRQLQNGRGRTKIAAAVECDIDEIMEKNALECLLRLEPFGPEKERPHFIDHAATIIHSKLLGDAGQHLQITIRGRYENYRAVGFGLGNRYRDIQKAPTRKVTFTPMINRFRGRSDWQLRIVDI